MRRSLLLLAALPLLFAPSASAADKKGERRSVCRVPDIDLEYDTQRFSAHVVLPVGGCASRENTQFTLSASIARLDNQWGRDVADRSTVCGPFPSADDMGPGKARGQYFCELDVALDHPEVEHAQYDIEVSYPGACGERTMSLFTFCRSDGETASCEK